MALDNAGARTRPVDAATEELLHVDGATSVDTRTSTNVMRIRMVIVGAIGVLFASGAPSVTVGVHMLHEPLSFENWTFSYPMTVIGLIGVALLWSSLSRRPIGSWPWATWPLGLLVVWSLLSVLWSVSPEVTGMRALTSVGVAGFAVWFGYELRFGEQLVALALFSVAVTAGSYVLVVLSPGIGRGDRSGWQGVFAGPNSLGPAAAIGIVTAIGIAVRFRHPLVSTFSLLAIVANIVLLREASSVTSVAGLFVAVVVAAVVVVVGRFRSGGASGRVVGTSVALVGGGALVVALARLGSIASFFGEDPTLTSRTLIWSDVRQFISDRPVTGYGYWAFWDNLEFAGPTYERIGAGYGSAHNSLLEMGLGLGVVGATLFAMVLLAGVVAVSLQVWRFGDAASMWWAALLGVLLTEHLMESFVLWHSYVWMLVIAAAVLPTSDRETIERWGHGASTLRSSSTREVR